MESPDCIASKTDFEPRHLEEGAVLLLQSSTLVSLYPVWVSLQQYTAVWRMDVLRFESLVKPVVHTAVPAYSSMDGLCSTAVVSTSGLMLHYGVQQYGGTSTLSFYHVILLY